MLSGRITRYPKSQRTSWKPYFLKRGGHGELYYFGWLRLLMSIEVPIRKELKMGEDINLEVIECYKDCYQLDIRYVKSGKGERFFVRKDALFALITVAEKNSITCGDYQQR